MGDYSCCKIFALQTLPSLTPCTPSPPALIPLPLVSDAQLCSSGCHITFTFFTLYIISLRFAGSITEAKVNDLMTQHHLVQLKTPGI